MLTLMSMMFACSGETPPPPPPPKPEPVVAPEPPPPPKMEAMTVDALITAYADNVGKEVMLKGFYLSMTKTENPAAINVPVFIDAEGKAQQVLCVASDMTQEAKYAEMGAGEELVVKGTVSAEKLMDTIKIENCMMTEEMEGKRGKGKAKADGEGKAKAGGDGEGKAKGGKKGG